MLNRNEALPRGDIIEITGHYVTHPVTGKFVRNPETGMYLPKLFMVTAVDVRVDPPRTVVSFHPSLTEALTL